MKQDVHVFIERDEEGWLVGSVPSLPGCHTQARTLDELAERMQEAIEAYLDAAGTGSSSVTSSEYSGFPLKYDPSAPTPERPQVRRPI